MIIFLIKQVEEWFDSYSSSTLDVVKDEGTYYYSIGLSFTLCAFSENYERTTRIFINMHDLAKGFCT